MTKQDDILQHFIFRRKSKKVTESKGPKKTYHTKYKRVTDLTKNTNFRKALRKLGREAKTNKYKAFKEYIKAMSSGDDDRAQKAREEFRKARDSYRKGNRSLAIDGGDPIKDHLNELLEAKKANDRSRQQHGEVQVKSYRRNCKIVRGYKRARRSSRGV